MPVLGAGSCYFVYWVVDGLYLRRWRACVFFIRGRHVPPTGATSVRCRFCRPHPHCPSSCSTVGLPSRLSTSRFCPSFFHPLPRRDPPRLPAPLPNLLCIFPCSSPIMMQAPSTWVHPPPPSAATVLTSWPGCGSVVSLWTDGTVASIGPGRAGAKRAERLGSPSSVVRAGGGGGRRIPRREWETGGDAAAVTGGGLLPADGSAAREGGRWPPAAPVAGAAATGRLLPVATPAVAVMVGVSSSTAPTTAAVATAGTRWQRVAVVGIGGVSGAAVGLAMAMVRGAVGCTATLSAAGGGVLGAVLVWVRRWTGARRRDEGWGWGGRKRVDGGGGWERRPRASVAVGVSSGHELTCLFCLIPCCDFSFCTGLDAPLFDVVLRIR